MIFISIFGGLGNQMFQFAAAYSLSLEKKTRLAINLEKINTAHKKDSGLTRRDFELNGIFSLPSYEVVNGRELDYILNPEANFLKRLKRKLKGTQAFYEQSLQYNPALHQLGNESYIEGYFQSQKYFESYQNEVVKSFQFRQSPSPKTLQLLEQMTGLTTIGVHVRRGDFVSSEVNLKTHGVCAPAYYEEAVRHFDKLNNICFVVVSDDPDWVKANIHLGQKTVYVDWNHGADSWQDMLILSKCDHAIIANSSFSWWGAYLIQNVHKIVIAPKVWYANPEKQAQTADLIPPCWIRC